jgi:hypothetical protein
MDVVSLSPVLSPKEIQRIRTRLAPFQTIHFTSAASEETRFRITPKVWLLPQALYKPTLNVIAFKQIIVFTPLTKRICALSEISLIEWPLNLTSPDYIIFGISIYVKLLKVLAGRTQREDFALLGRTRTSYMYPCTNHVFSTPSALESSFDEKFGQLIAAIDECIGILANGLGAASAYPFKQCHSGKREKQLWFLSSRQRGLIVDGKILNSDRSNCSYFLIYSLVLLLQGDRLDARVAHPEGRISLDFCRPNSLNASSVVGRHRRCDI